MEGGRDKGRKAGKGEWEVERVRRRVGCGYGGRKGKGVREQ